jgi:ribosome biogenesis GTPase A
MIFFILFVFVFFFVFLFRLFLILFIFLVVFFMASSFYKHIYDLIDQSDLIVEILDARHPVQTRNQSLEDMVVSAKKKLLFVLNKCDLVEKKLNEKTKAVLEAETKCRVVFLSALHHNGINNLRQQIGIMSKGITPLTIGIIGYPNTGKSTLINALAGKGRARVKTSKKAGLTRGMQKIKITDGIYLIDSPGIIPKGTSEFDLFLINAKNPNQVKDVEANALSLIENLGVEKVSAHYKVKVPKDAYELLDLIGIKKGFLQKGGGADIPRTARQLLEDYQSHKLQ